MNITETPTTITATGCGRYNQTIVFNLKNDNLYHMIRRDGGIRPGWSKEKVFSYLNYCWN